MGFHLFGVRNGETSQFDLVKLNDVRGHVTSNDFRPASDVLNDLSKQLKKQRSRDVTHKPKLNKKLKQPQQ
jgi:hypothetical protein